MLRLNIRVDGSSSNGEAVVNWKSLGSQFLYTSSSSSRWERILRLNGSLIYGISVIRLMKWRRVTLQICYEMPKVVCCPFRNLIFQYWSPFSWHDPLVLKAIGSIVSFWIIKNNDLKGLRLCQALKFKGMQHLTYCSAMKKCLDLNSIRENNWVD